MQRSNTRVLEYTGCEPLRIEEAKAYLRVSHAGDDDYLAHTLIPAARSYAERFMGVSLQEKSVNTKVVNAEKNYQLPYWPVADITESTPGGLTQNDGVLDNESGATIDVTYTTEAYVMPEVKQALLNLISHWYVTRDMSNVPDAVINVFSANKRNLWFA
jgi:hypothetical protein